MFTKFYIKTIKTMTTYEGEVMDFGEEFVNVEKSLERGKIYDSTSAERGSCFSTEKDALEAISTLSSIEVYEIKGEFMTLEATKLGTVKHSLKVDTINYEYANMSGYSDVKPFEIVRVISDKTIEIREMDAEKGDWKPEFIAGGFAGRCVNQDDQVWNIKSNEANPVIRARRNKDGWKSSYGKHFLSTQPSKFHDYNF